MAIIEAKNVIEQLNWRYATKEFDAKRTIPEAVIKSIEEALVLTPSSFGLQPWKFIIVEDQELKDQMPAVSWNQQQVKDCSHMVVLTVKTGYSREEAGRFIKRMAEVQGVEIESLAAFEKVVGGFIDKANENGFVEDWAKNQIYIALGQLMFAAAMFGVDACPMEGIQPAGYDEILDLEGTGYSTVVVCPLGYRSAGDKYATTPKVRYAANDVIERR